MVKSGFMWYQKQMVLSVSGGTNWFYVVTSGCMWLKVVNRGFMYLNVVLCG